ncbi:cytochrome P450 CYP749A22-like protein [Tanacetum coccineum]
MPWKVTLYPEPRPLATNKIVEVAEDYHVAAINAIEAFVIRSGYQQKDRKPSQNDKTEHGMEKTVQKKSRPKSKMSKSESKYEGISSQTGAGTEDYYGMQSVTHLYGRESPIVGLLNVEGCYNSLLSFIVSARNANQLVRELEEAKANVGFKAQVDKLQQERDEFQRDTTFKVGSSCDSGMYGIAITRKVLRERKVGKVVLPANLKLQIPTLALQHDPKIWGEDAHLFKPDRFSEGIAKATNNPGAFLPFGYGPRNCVGSSFAINEAKIALSMILQHYRFTPSPSYVHAPVQIVTLRPKFGVRIMFQAL